MVRSVRRNSQTKTRRNSTRGSQKRNSYKRRKYSQRRNTTRRSQRRNPYKRSSTRRSQRRNPKRRTRKVLIGGSEAALKDENFKRIIDKTKFYTLFSDDDGTGDYTIINSKYGLVLIILTSGRVRRGKVPGVSRENSVGYLIITQNEPGENGTTIPSEKVKFAHGEFYTIKTDNLQSLIKHLEGEGEVEGEESATCNGMAINFTKLNYLGNSPIESESTTQICDLIPNDELTQAISSFDTSGETSHSTFDAGEERIRLNKVANALSEDPEQTELAQLKAEDRLTKKREFQIHKEQERIRGMRPNQRERESEGKRLASEVSKSLEMGDSLENALRGVTTRRNHMPI